MAATSSPHAQSIQLKEEVDENFLCVDVVAFDGQYYSTRRELESRVSVGETNTYTRPQLRSNGPAMADEYSGVCHVEAWIDQELFGDVREASQLQHQGEGELDISTLWKHVLDEYIEMVDFTLRSATDWPAIGYGMDDFEQYYIEQPQGRDDMFLSPVESEQSGMYYDEPQLWCFST